MGQDDITMGAPFKGNPTLAELLSHVETTYPSFWAIVVVPLEDPLNKLYVSSFVLLAACVLLGFYGVCLPVCRPYTDKRPLERNEGVRWHLPSGSPPRTSACMAKPVRAVILHPSNGTVQIRICAVPCFLHPLNPSRPSAGCVLCIHLCLKGGGLLIRIHLCLQCDGLHPSLLKGCGGDKILQTLQEPKQRVPAT